MERKTALVVGVTGLVGFNLAKRLIQEGWCVYGISRRKPDYLPSSVNHVSVDLTNRDESKKLLAPLHSITHVFFATWLSKVRPGV